MRGPIRRFSDSRGTRWAVRVERRPDVVLAIGPGNHSLRRDRDWLYFRSPGSTRRIDIYPADWYDLDVESLERILGLTLRAPA